MSPYELPQTMPRRRWQPSPQKTRASRRAGGTATGSGPQPAAEAPPAAEQPDAAAEGPPPDEPTAVPAESPGAGTLGGDEAGGSAAQLELSATAPAGGGAARKARRAKSPQKKGKSKAGASAGEVRGNKLASGLRRPEQRHSSSNPLLTRLVRRSGEGGEEGGWAQGKPRRHP